MGILTLNLFYKSDNIIYLVGGVGILFMMAYVLIVDSTETIIIGNASIVRRNSVRRVEIRYEEITDVILQEDPKFFTILAAEKSIDVGTRTEGYDEILAEIKQQYKLQEKQRKRRDDSIMG